MLDLELLGRRLAKPDGLCVALTCFDDYAVEIGHQDIEPASSGIWLLFSSRRISFEVDIVMLTAYTLSTVTIELLVPGTLETSTAKIEILSYCWRKR